MSICIRRNFFVSLHRPIWFLGVQWNFSGSNTDGSFTMAVSNSFLSPLEKKPVAADMG